MERIGKILPFVIPHPPSAVEFTKNALVGPPTQSVSTEMCPCCKIPYKDMKDGFGWLRVGPAHDTTISDFGPHTNWKQRLVPCPECSTPVQQRGRQVKLEELVHRLFHGEPQIPYFAEEWTFATFPKSGDQKALQTSLDFIASHLDRSKKNHTAKRGLWLAGPVGRGKTSLALSAYKEIIAAGGMALFVSVPMLMDRLRASFGKESPDTEDELLKVITTIPWLFLDDLGVEKPTSYVIGRFYNIITTRHGTGRYTVFTSNLSTPDLEKYWRPVDEQTKQLLADGVFHPGIRVVERIRDYCVGITVSGPNLREKGW